MNATILQEALASEYRMSAQVSRKAKKLVDEFQSEVSDSMEWSNKRNIDITRIKLLAYIALLESK